MSKKSIFFLLLIIALVVMQFFRIDKTNPAVDASKDFINTVNPPAEIAGMIRAACYDCHSHESKYPWYTNIAPVSWWIKGHIDEGKKHLNFSEWTDYPADERSHNLKECAEVLEETRMPLTPYILLHSEARISKEQRKQLGDWFLSIK